MAGSADEEGESVSVRTFGIVLLVLAVGILGYVGYLFANQWEPYAVGDRYEVRRNRFTGIVEIRREGNWVRSFEDNPYADALSEADLQRVTLRDVAWGRERGLLGVTAVVKPGAPVKGRLGVQVIILGPDGKRRVTESERVLRGAVDWPGGSQVPFVVPTGLTPPGPKYTYKVPLVPLFSEAGSGAQR